MKSRTLGLSNIQVSSLGLGCMSMSPGIYSKPDEAQSLKTLHTALELGINFFDTADMYGKGHNERFITKVLKPVRNQIVIGTKCGLVFEGDSLACNSSRQYIKQACEASLQRLQTDIIDIYYLHRKNPATPIEESMEAMRELHTEGKIRAAGLSEVDARTIERANAIFPVAAVQSEYSILFRDAAESVLPTCKALGIAFVAFSPIGRGFITGTLESIHHLDNDDFRRSLPFLQAGNIERNLDLVRALATIAKRKHSTPAQIALAWLLAQGPHIIPIPGTSNPNHLQENIEAANIILGASELNELNALCAQTPVQGKRFPQELQNWFVEPEASTLAV